MTYTGRALVVAGGVVYRDNPVTALPLDPGGRYRYAATLCKIHVIDRDPNSPDYLKIISNDPTRTIDVSIPAANGGTPYGHVTDIALNANGKRLYVTVPVSEMYGPNGWVWQAGNDEGQVIVINVDENDRTDPESGKNARNWREVIARRDAGMEPFEVIAVPNDHNSMIVAARGSMERGVSPLQVANDRPLNFRFDESLQQIATRLNAAQIGATDDYTKIRR